MLIRDDAFYYRVLNLDNNLYLGAKGSFNAVGNLYKRRADAERRITELSRVRKASRDTKAKNVLYGNNISSKLKIVKSKLIDIK